jgi:hypothetical protein
MRLTRSLSVAVLAVVFGLTSGTAFGDPKKKKGTEEAGDKGLDRQMAWENKVMGDDSAKQAELKKIANAQRLAEEARKNPPPPPAPKVKDPNKEGVRAKQEAEIGLPIESEEASQRQAKKSGPAKKAETANSANDELGQLVASSLAADRAQERDREQAEARAARPHHGKRGPVKGRTPMRGRAPSPSSSSSLDQLLGGN